MPRFFKSIALSAAMSLSALLPAAPALAQNLQSLTVAGGCFWCVEADFESVPGVVEAVSGFAGGITANPTYEQVTAGGTGHYEAVRISYDADRISAATIYDMFFRSIDPTDAGGQFCDRGDSYRTAIFADTPELGAAAEAARARAQASLSQPIVTPILEGAPFYPASDYHQDYYKSSERLAVSSVGLFVPKSEAYKRYREGCGRDARVAQLWGSEAPFLR